jgi:hypothetical protein
MPTTVRGRQLGVAENGVFTTANTDPIPGGRLWPEAALTWNAMHAAYVADGGHPADFAPAGLVSSARPRSAQDHFWTHQPPAAARPYTSNHGWAIAVDVKTRAAAAWLLTHGPKYGWSHDEGASVGEWWHFRYVGASPALLRRLRRDPLAGYTAAERRWIAELDRGPAPARRRVLVRVMTVQRKRIYRLAQPRAKCGDGKGWTRTRRRRYDSLKARTT